MKFCNTPTLIELNEEVIKNPHANRALDEKIYDHLDPEGYHLLDSSHIVFRMAGHGFVRPYLYLKFKDRDKPVEGNTIDLSGDQWDRLEVYTQKLNEILESGKECSSCKRVMPHKINDYVCIICREES